MTRLVPVDRPLSDEDREYLHARGEHDRVEYIDAQHGKAGDAAQGEDLFVSEDDKPYEEWTVAELQGEIDARNADGRADDKKLNRNGNKAQLADRLRADDVWLDEQTA